MSWNQYMWSSLYGSALNYRGVPFLCSFPKCLLAAGSKMLFHRYFIMPGRFWIEALLGADVLLILPLLLQTYSLCLLSVVVCSLLHGFLFIHNFPSTLDLCAKIILGTWDLFLNGKTLQIFSCVPLYECLKNSAKKP